PAGVWPWVVAPLDFLSELNPVLVLASSMGGLSGLGAGFNFAPVLRMAAWHAGFAVGMTALATVAVRRVQLREVGRGSVDRRWIRLPSLPRWRPAIGEHPMLWKEAFAATAKTKLGLIGSASVLALGLCALGSIAYMFIEIIVEAPYRTGSYGPDR